MANIFDILNERILVLDGAMGTMIQQYKFSELFGDWGNKSINESYFDSNKLYNKSYIDSVTKNADRNIKRIVKNLDTIKCQDKNNNPTECVRIPEVLFVYINGRY